ncbi:MAG: flippase-like domain-containing protein [Verrucomicrobia bacterium]|nr:flippase-like domain-containing protein [Verrucomicrobiota bacterium]
MGTKSFWPKLLTVFRLVVPWLAVGCVILALLPRAGDLRQCVQRLGCASLAPAFCLCLGYWFFNAGVWSWILESLGYPIEYLTSVRVFLTSESMRWLPGGVWKFASRVVAAQNLGIPIAIASLSLPVELATVVVSWMVVALAGTICSGLAGRFVAAYSKWFLPAAGAALVSLLLFGLVWPMLSRQPWIRAKLGQLGEMLKLKPNLRALIRAELMYILLNVFHGVGLWLMLAGMGYQLTVSPAAAIGANAVGWLVGFFAMAIPGGMGVRETATAFLLSPVMPWQEAALAAVLWRALQIAAELISLTPWLFIRGRPVVQPVSIQPGNQTALEQETLL